LGTPLGLYTRPPNAFCADFLGEANLLSGTGVMVQESGDGSVETPLGKWRMSGASPALKSGRTGCLIRPENLRPVTGDGGGLNVFEAEVTALRMNGATVTVSLSAAGMELKATLLTAQSLDLRKGDRGRWGVAPGNVVLIER
jgi:ABC-type Fe3+/spermidine/putrescine transport system ATPase subunit